MKKFIVLLPLRWLVLPAGHLSAQCSMGETPVVIQIETDLYAYEGYWALYPAGSTCGAGNIASGGNAAQVGCNGAGQRDATSGFGYAANQTVTSGPHCLITDGNYSIRYVDDYADGGFKFTVFIAGLPLHRFQGNGNNTVFTFEAMPPAARDAGIKQITSGVYYPAGDVPVKGKIFNYGSSAIYAVTVSYSVNNSNPVSEDFTGFTILPYETEYEFSFTNPWNATDTGTCLLKVWTSAVNNQPDMNAANDTLEKTIIIGKPVPNLIDRYLTDTLTYTIIGNISDGVNMPRDLDFHPVLSNYDLWVINEGNDFGGSTVTFFNAGRPTQTSLKKVDENVYHFMLRPTGIAFSENTNFAISPGVYDANHGSGPFTGPSLWTSDMSIYAEPTGPLGSHIDMLHQSPFSMGIAAERDNAFWVFDGDAGNIVRYDFRQDHGPGNDDHSDGLVWRYTEVQVRKLNDAIPSHLVLDEQKKWLYIVDGGNQRVLRMDITTGSPSGNIVQFSEPLAEYKRYTGVTWEPIITSGLVEPCGIDIMGSRLLVSDHSNGDIVIYDINATPVTELGRIHTHQPGIQGIKIGPDGKIWYVNRTNNEVIRIDGPQEQPPVNTAIREILPELNVFPNPAIATAGIYLSGVRSGIRTDLKLFDASGKCVLQKVAFSNFIHVNLAGFARGGYLLSVVNEHFSDTQKIIKQ